MRIDGICSYFFVQISKDFKHKRSIHDHSSDDIEDMVRDKTDVLVNEAHLHENQRKHDGKNLLAAFSGESQARTRYSYFAGVAKKEGYEQISGIFLETRTMKKNMQNYFSRF
jgi:hypothetical protein